MKALIDNDILFKGACYGLLDELVLSGFSDIGSTGVLGSARFVVPKRIERTSLRRTFTTALGNPNAFLNRTAVVEPTDYEQAMAADFERTAQRARVSLDTGESQLCAILISRLVPLLLTGDKRAIEAAETLLDADSRLRALCGKVKCLEQLVLQSLHRGNERTLRDAICAEPGVDKALAICFSCENPGASTGRFSDGLQSYIGTLRAAAGRVLAP